MIKPLSQSDFASAYRIEKTSNPFAWTQQALLTSLATDSSLGFYRHDELVAFVLYRVVVDEAEILHIVCRQQVGNQGIATQLLQALTAGLTSQGVNKLLLEVRQSNQIANHLYHKLGFVIDGKRLNYYQNQETALLMHLDLSLAQLSNGNVASG